MVCVCLGCFLFYAKIIAYRVFVTLLGVCFIACLMQFRNGISPYGVCSCSCYLFLVVGAAAVVVVVVVGYQAVSAFISRTYALLIITFVFTYSTTYALFSHSQTQKN